MTIFGYTRISVDLQEDYQENTSIENQKAIITRFVAEKFPSATLQIFEDRDRSGYTFLQRTQYQAMRNRLLSGESNILVIKDFSRFSRRNSLGLCELEILRDSGVRIIAIGDNIDYPTKDDWMLIQFKFLLNEMPVTETSKKIRQVVASRQKEGKWIIQVAYGYRKTGNARQPYEVDPAAADVVREIFRLYNLGWGGAKIAKHLAELGIPSPRESMNMNMEERGLTPKTHPSGVWGHSAVDRIIRNDLYIGTLRQHKYEAKGIHGAIRKVDEDEQIVIENAHPAIIDERTFAIAQEQVKLRAVKHYRGTRKESSPYFGLIRCGLCGSSFYSIRKDATKKDKNEDADNRPLFYLCSGYHARGKAACVRNAISKKVLDDALKEYIVLIRNNCEEMLDSLSKAIQDQPKKDKDIENAVSDISKQIDFAKNQLRVLYKEKIMSSVGVTEDQERIRGQVFEEMEDELTKRVAYLEKQLREVNDRRNAMIQVNRKARTVIDSFDIILQKEELGKEDVCMIVEQIIIYPTHIDIKLKANIDALLSVTHQADSTKTLAATDNSDSEHKDEDKTSMLEPKDLVWSQHCYSAIEVADTTVNRRNKAGCMVHPKVAFQCVSTSVPTLCELTPYEVFALAIDKTALFAEV